MEEITKLSHTKCPNDEVGRAFLFSCVTGIRYCDVKDLKWVNIKGEICRIVQEKTANGNVVLLNNTAIRMVGERGLDDQKIFPLPSFHTCLKVLKKWGEGAGVDKHITWHVSRHSFATNLLINDTDIKTTAGLLGHRGLKHVDRYVRLVKSLQDKAVNKLEISI
jgi:integrase